jgi:thiol-disulfide isomerase/thioredoxin
MRLTLLTRGYCHLCDEMAEALAPIASAVGAAVVLVDVDAPGNEELEETWGDRVPALFAGAPADGILLCTISLDPSRVAAVLAGAAQPPVVR